MSRYITHWHLLSDKGYGRAVGCCTSDVRVDMPSAACTLLYWSWIAAVVLRPMMNASGEGERWRLVGSMEEITDQFCRMEPGERQKC